ncbi:MAG TPA: carboxypeptidase regulatory-like domain-containing protein [Candidatus Dormibacteraeota bacterium]|nr:carboxypeptidase regulatory-like domain-containing protein [Candidatus Dormibacteraeota bacterium]
MKYQGAFGCLAVLLCWLNAAGAQIMVVRADGTACMQSGLSSNLKNCDVPEWYAYAFIGSISAVTPIEHGESEIQVSPEEVFHGDPGTSLTVRTSQGACLPNLAVGDRWLFFLRNAKPFVLDYYGNDSRPVADVQEKIEMLRHLQNTGDFGILRGHVQRGSSSLSEGGGVPNAHVVARRTSDNTQFVAISDADGRYEFPPVPSGKYKVNLDQIVPLAAGGGELKVGRGACWDLTLEVPKESDGSISGHIGTPDGKPFVVHRWVDIASVDEERWTTAEVDKDGYYEARGIEPGRYVVGIGIRRSGFAPLPIPVYYPGVRSEKNATIIELGRAQKRTHIDFALPVEDDLRPF